MSLRAQNDGIIPNDRETRFVYDAARKSELKKKNRIQCETNDCDF